MPSNYAHYRFGAEMLATLPGDIRRSVQRFRRLYDVGLHGPDIFFYYDPVIKTRVGKLGSRYHAQSGREFFSHVCRQWRLEPTEAGLSYLYGVLCHYSLDSHCHPTVEQISGIGAATHFELETEFDRYLLELDGKIPPHTQDLSRHIRLTPGECATAAAFYSRTTQANVRRCIANMALFTRLLAPADDTRRKLLRNSLALTRTGIEGMLMHTVPDPKCAGENETLLSLYRRAAESFPSLCRQLQDHISHNAPLGEEFAPSFG